MMPTLKTCYFRMSFCLFFYQNVLVQFEKTIIPVCFVVFPEKKMLNLKLFFLLF